MAFEGGEANTDRPCQQPLDRVGRTVYSVGVADACYRCNHNGQYCSSKYSKEGKPKGTAPCFIPSSLRTTETGITRLQFNQSHRQISPYCTGDNCEPHQDISIHPAANLTCNTLEKSAVWRSNGQLNTGTLDMSGRLGSGSMQIMRRWTSVERRTEIEWSK